MTESASATLFDRVGGQTAVSGLVDAFYERVLADALLKPFFVSASMERLRRMQSAFFAAALDGPVPYTGRSIAEIHAGMGIEPRHLARFLEHLVDTLRDRGLDDQDVYDICSCINTYADELLGRSNVDG